jgi:hypothetical protein
VLDCVAPYSLVHGPAICLLSGFWPASAIICQMNHPMNQILGDIRKGVTTHSRLANFCENYSFVSYIKPFRVEAAL